MKKKLISIILAIAMLACMIPLGTMTAFAEVDANHIHEYSYSHKTEGGVDYLVATCKNSECDPIVFQPIADLAALKSLVSNGGIGYLTSDITLDAALTSTSSKSVSLCLNDHALNLNKKFISISNFTLYDCGKTVRYYSKDTNGMWTLVDDKTSACTTVGGIIFGGSGSKGSICVTNNFIMYSGNIVGNKCTTSNTNYGSVAVTNSFTMYDGTICGNYSVGYGGGIRCNNSNTCASFMYGGSICDNICNSMGGGVYYSWGSFTMTGGSICGNTCGNSSYGGGLCGGANVVSPTIGGTAVISGNKKANGTPDNVGIRTGKVIYLGTGMNKPAAGFNIEGVTTQTAPTEDAPVTITGTADAFDVSYFTADNGSMYVRYNETESNLEMALIADDDLKVKLDKCENGYLLYDHQYAKQGETVRIKAIADEGYEVKSVKFNGEAATKGEGDVYSFAMPNEAVTVTAVFGIPHTHHAGTEYMTDGRAHWLKCDDENCPLNKADDPVLAYEIAFSSYEGPELKELLDYSEKCGTYSEEKTSMLMGRQGKLDKSTGTVSNTDGRTIIGLTQDQLDKIGNKLVIVGSDDSDNNKQVSVNVDCAYTWFYNVDAQTGETVKVEAANTTDLNGNPIAAFVIIDSSLAGTITGYGYYRIYNDVVSDSNLIGEILYKAPRTYKAVYDTTGSANTLTFYYDAVDHSGEGKTVYEGSTGEYYLFDGTKTGVKFWGYNGNRGNIKSVVIDSSVAKYHGLTSTAYMFQGMTAATTITGAEYLDVSNVTDMSLMFMNFGGGSTNSHTTLNSVPDVSKWNTANVTNMTGMFWDYGNFSDNLTKVPDVSKWNTANVTNMAGMFQQYGYSSINFNDVPKVSGWSTVSVEDMSTMFRYYGKNSTALTAVPEVCNWNTAEVKTMAEMFREYGASSTVLKAVPDVSGWNTSNVTTMINLFQNYGNGSVDFQLDLSGWDLSKIASDKGNNVFDFNQKTFDVKIPAKIGEKSNETGKWYYGDGTSYIIPAAGESFTFAN